MKLQKDRLGQQGEEAAIKFLKNKGYRILERNFRCPLGEIDVIAKHQGYLVFIEVKTRSSTKYGLPEEAINFYKQRKLKQLAHYYLKFKKLSNIKCRIDVVSVLSNRQNGFQIKLIPNAF